MTDAARWPLVWSTGPLCAVQPAYSIATPLNLCMHSETFYKESAKLCNQITSVHEKRRLKSVWLRRCCYFLSASARSNRNWCGERNGKHNSNNGRPGGGRGAVMMVYDWRSEDQTTPRLSCCVEAMYRRHINSAVTTIVAYLTVACSRGRSN